MEHATKHNDDWTEFADLLGIIRALFGHALSAAEALAPKLAHDAARWLRGRSVCARAAAGACAHDRV